MGALEIYVLNVGQADAAIIRTPDDNIIIIDAYNPAKVKYVLDQIAPGGEISHLIVTHPRWQSHPIGLSRLRLIVGRWSDRQDLADRLDSMDLSAIVDVLHHDFRLRSSSACAKYADASRKMAFARLSSRFSRSSPFIRFRSSVVSPARRP